MPLETGENMQYIDLFGQWFGPEYQGVAYSLETDLAYVRQSCLDDEEWQVRREEAIEELEMELPSGYTLDAIYVTGFVFVRDGNDKYTLEFCDSDMVAVDGAAFIEVRESEFGQLFAYEIDVCVVRVHVYILYGHNLCETVVSDLKLSTSTSEEVDELFRLALAAAWP
jgi:hypothetical protein